MSLPTPRRRQQFASAALILLAVLASSCGGGVRPTLTDDRIGESVSDSTVQVPTVAPVGIEPAPTPIPEVVDTVEQLVVQVLDEFPHDDTAFTQGLELVDGVFIESTGRYGQSELRRVTPGTGEVLQSVPTPNDYFAEGVTRVGEDLIQLTWRENTVYYWDVTTFEMRKQVAFLGEGWGLCYDGEQLIMSDGLPELIFRDPLSFVETGRVIVTLRGQPVININELECVDGVVWANIWQTDTIYRINPSTGEVTGVVDASGLEADADRADGAVLNGIAWDDSTNSFYVTGKLWPTMFRVNFIPAPTS